MKNEKNIIWFEDIDTGDTAEVGGKNSSLGEMIAHLGEAGVKIPEGFATTAHAYRTHIENSGIDEQIQEKLEKYKNGSSSLEKTGRAIRELFLDADFSESLSEDISRAYEELSSRYENGNDDSDMIDVAVRSSATAEDLPDASFAGQQESFLNISGSRALLDACRKCFASLFTDRAISYREEKGFDHMEVALSVGVQKMVRSDKAGSGVMFTLDTETGFPDTVIVDAVWGLGENIVQGTVTPDSYRIYKPFLKNKQLCPIISKELGSKKKTMIYAEGDSQTTRNIDTPRKKRNSFVLSDEEVLQLAVWGADIEEHYGAPMDIEWAKDGATSELFIVQARPETVQSRKEKDVLVRYSLTEKGSELASGLAVGDAIASGKAVVLDSLDATGTFEDGNVLVTEMTDPDWGPLMKRASAIVTEHGGRTSHSAIVSRELGIPAIVGAIDAMEKLSGVDSVTVSCAEGDKGIVYDGELDFEEEEIDLKELEKPDVSIMLNIATPDAAFRWWRLPTDGIGLARMEFIINNIIKIHPMALVDPDRVENEEERSKIDRITANYDEKSDYFIDRTARGLGSIAASCYPRPVIVRLSDLKTNEYANLIGGSAFEPKEENPMLGFRGASRYYSDRYRPGFDLECLALKRAREYLGFDNIAVMVPFCRTLGEADKVIDILNENGLVRGENGLEILVMCEIPANVILAEDFAERFDGFSIGSNDLTQLTLGIDRDLAELRDLFDERNEAVKKMIRDLIETAHSCGAKVGLCGQAPSDYPEFAEFLVAAGIDSMSLNPDSVLPVMRHLAEQR